MAETILMVSGVIGVIVSFIFAGITVALGVKNISTAESIHNEVNISRILCGQSVLIMGLWSGGGLFVAGLLLYLIKLVSPYIQ